MKTIILSVMAAIVLTFSVPALNVDDSGDPAKTDGRTFYLAEGGKGVGCQGCQDRLGGRFPQSEHRRNAGRHFHPDNPQYCNLRFRILNQAKFGAPGHFGRLFKRPKHTRMPDELIFLSSLS
ncbi:MAG: hypothetical protein LBE84_11950 [Planctomycetota bacterium]|nr:hypothetical protein [Planctomycetota bacterium]